MFFRLFVFVKFPTLLPQSSATKAQTQAIGMTQVETKSHMQTQVQAKSSGEPSKLFRREVIWIQCSKYPCACVMPEQYFVFTCCSANTSIRPSTRKREKNCSLSLFLRLCLCLREGCFHGEIGIIVFALSFERVLALLSENQALASNSAWLEDLIVIL